MIALAARHDARTWHCYPVPISTMVRVFSGRDLFCRYYARQNEYRVSNLFFFLKKKKSSKKIGPRFASDGRTYKSRRRGM